MLPTEGYFSSFPCPYFESGSCERPHCHFRHCKEDKLNNHIEERNATNEQLIETKTIQTNLIQHLVEETVKKVLSRTDISEKSAVDTNAIVEDVVKTLKKPNLETSESHKTFIHAEPITTPSYKPTPISELKKHIPVMCAPTKPVIDLWRKRKTLENNSGYVGSTLNANSDITSKESLAKPTNKYELFLQEELHKDLEKSKSKVDDNTYNPCIIKNHILPKSNDIVEPFIETITEADIEPITEADIEPEEIPVETVQIEKKKETSHKEYKKSSKSSHSDSKKSEKKRDKSDNKKEVSNKYVNGKSSSNKERSSKERSNKSKSRGHESSRHRERSKKKKKHSDKDREKPESIKSDKDREKTESIKSRLEPTIIPESIVLTSDDDDVMFSAEFNSPPTPEAYSPKMVEPLSPPNKKLKIDGQSVGDVAQMSLCERWRKVRENINKRSSGERIKISQVPNVSSLLSAKDTLLSKAHQQQIIVPKLPTPIPATSTSSTIDDEPSVAKKVRVSHVPKIDYPNLLMEPDLKVPHSVRQLGLNNIYDAVCKYVEFSKARELAQREELKVCKRVHVVKTYKNSIAMLILRIRRDKGVISDEKDSESEKCTHFKSSSIPDFTYGLSFYKCFLQYLMSENDFIVNGYPLELKSKKNCAYIDRSYRRAEAQQPTEENSRICANCSSHYFVNDYGLPIKENDCFYHWGKVIKVKGSRGWVEKYRCCGADVGSDPCTTGQFHVSSTFNEDCLEGFVTSRPLSSGHHEESAGIYAMDCEMCFTTIGSELTRCTLVDLNGQVVYDKIVVPEHPILDYCTRFSGITEEIIKKASVNIKTVQKDLLKLINQKTILIGHSLENDFKALKLIHRSVVDTSIVFPHKMGLPYKNALKRLVKDLLNMCIQENESGHDSFEDANACMKLMLWKIKEDSKKRKPRVIIGLNDKRKH